jgi:hypothetical protein
MGILEILAKAPDADGLKDYLPKAQAYVDKQMTALRKGQVPQEKLLMSLRLTREMNEYSSPSPAARAAKQRSGCCDRDRTHIRVPAHISVAGAEQSAPLPPYFFSSSVPKRLILPARLGLLRMLPGF